MQDVARQVCSAIKVQHEGGGGGGGCDENSSGQTWQPSRCILHNAMRHIGSMTNVVGVCVCVGGDSQKLLSISLAVKRKGYSFLAGRSLPVDNKTTQSEVSLWPHVA